MNTKALSAFFTCALAMQLFAMEKKSEEKLEVVNAAEEYSPFDYFDQETCSVDQTPGQLTLNVAARHLPTLRTYSASISQSGIQAYYQKKDTDKKIWLGESKTRSLFSTLLKVTDLSKPVTSLDKKELLDQLHATLTKVN